MEAKDRDAAEAEFGDLLFTAMNLARHLKVDAESALRRSNAKFRSGLRRWSGRAADAKGWKRGRPDELEALWAAAKSDRS